MNTGRSMKSRQRARGQSQEEYHLQELLDELIKLRNDASQAAQISNKANELARRAIQHASTGVNVTNVLRRIIREVEAIKIVSPKLFYSLLMICSRQDHETAMMVAGLLQRRCSDPDDKIRASSLRMLSSLRIHNLIDTIMPSVEAGLADVSAVVRAAAVVAVMKIADLDEDLAESAGLWDRVLGALRADPSPDVRYLCFVVCLQKKHERELLEDREFMTEIMVGLQTYRPFQQARILSLLALYKPSEQPTTAFGHSAPGVPEVGAYMDSVEPCLSSIDSSTKLSAINALLQWAKSTENEFWYSQALDRVKKPLYGLMKRSDPEIAMVALMHIKLLVQRAQYAFADDYQQFYCRHADVPYLKILKMGILKYLATEENQHFLVAELMEYTKERSVEVGRAAVRALSHIALSLSDTAGLIENFMDLLGCGDNNILSEVVIMVRNMLRKFPDVAAPFAPALQQVQLSCLQTEEARAAYLWIRSHLDSLLLPEDEGAQPTPYVLEEMADRWSKLSHVEKGELLWATPRVAFVRAPATVPVLRKVLFEALRDSDTMIADYARLVMHTLHRGLDTAQALLAPPLQATRLQDGKPEHLLEELISEFNTLAVVFEKPSRMFVDPKAYPHREVLPHQSSGRVDAGHFAAPGGGDDADALLLDLDGPVEDISRGPSDAEFAHTSFASGHDLMSDFDQLGVAAPAALAGIFDPDATMDKATFQAAWMALPNAAYLTMPLTHAQLQALHSAQPKPFAGLHHALAESHIKIFAEGGSRAFLFARTIAQQQPAFLECQIQEQGAEGALIVTIKSPDEVAAECLQRIWQDQATTYLSQM